MTRRIGSSTHHCNSIIIHDPICIIPFHFQDKDTPFVIANQMGRSDVVSTLVQHGAKLDVCGEVCEGEG